MSQVHLRASSFTTFIEDLFIKNPAYAPADEKCIKTMSTPQDLKVTKEFTTI